MLTVLATNGTQYRIPAALRRALQVRDGTCRLPGRRRSATACDLDHVIAWADGGDSTPANLAHLCRKHHVLKHHSGWTVSAARDTANTVGTVDTDRHDSRDGHDTVGPAEREALSSSVLTWTSPAGRRYTTRPADPPPF